MEPSKMRVLVGQLAALGALVMLSFYLFALRPIFQHNERAPYGKADMDSQVPNVLFPHDDLIMSLPRIQQHNVR
jgi:hypothetical protein